MSSPTRQLPQRQAELILQGAVRRQARQGVADLVRAVAEPGQGGPHLGAGRGRPGLAAGPVDPRDGPDADELDVGAIKLDVEPGLQLDEQSGGGLLADAGNQHQGIGIVGEHRPLQRERGMHRQQGQGHRRADAVGADQGFEAHPLVAGREAVEDDGVLADVGVDVQERRAPRAADPGEGASRHQRPDSRPPRLPAAPRRPGPAGPPGPGRTPAVNRSQPGLRGSAERPGAAWAGSRGPEPGPGQVADGQGQGVGPVRRTGGLRQLQQDLHHALHLVLASQSRSRQRPA